MRRIKNTDVNAEDPTAIIPLEKYYSEAAAIIGFIVFEILAIMTFVQVNANLQPDNPDV